MKEYITCRGLTKKYDDIYALNKLDMTLETGKIYGLIGRNGAGKTTLLKMMANQVFPTSGNMQIPIKAGEKVCLSREVLPKIATEYKLRDIFAAAALSYPNWNEPLKEELTQAFGLNVKKRYRKLSKGMQTMVGIVIGLCSRAAITCFDEPYVGLDPVGREVFYRYLQEEYTAYPRTFIISTHLMNELQNMFEEVILLDKGKTIFHKTMEELSEGTYTLEGREEDVMQVIAHKNVIGTEKVGRFMVAHVMDRLSEEEQRRATELNVKISGMDLQTLFVKLTSKGKGEF